MTQLQDSIKSVSILIFSANDKLFIVKENGTWGVPGGLYNNNSSNILKIHLQQSGFKKIKCTLKSDHNSKMVFEGTDYVHDETINHDYLWVDTEAYNSLQELGQINDRTTTILTTI